MEKTTIFYNNDTDRNLTHRVVDLIDTAKEWIKACNLYFDDLGIREALQKALERGVAVLVLTNLDGATGEESTRKNTGKKGHVAQTTQNFMHSAALSKLYDAGAHISGLDGLHAKFLLTDTGEGMITSLNFTPNSTNSISELGVEVHGDEYDELEKIFDLIFLRPDQYRFASYGSHFTYERPSETIDDSLLSRMSHIKMTLAPSNRGSGNALSDCDIHDLRDEIFDIINSAESGEDLYVATYSLHDDTVNTDGQKIGEALLQAKERGVKLKILMRKENYKYMKGLFVHLHKDNHAKAVLTTERGIIFTGNLTTESFENGFDLGVTLTPDQIADTKIFIDQLIEQTKQ